MRLLIVIVNYRTADLTVDCLRSLAAEVGPAGASVVVTDNHSGDDSAKRIQSAINENAWAAWATVQPLDRNGGFAYGNNAGIRPALESSNPPDYVLLLNPDTVVRPGALKALLDFMDANPNTGIAGSRLEHPTGEPQRSAFRFHSIASEFESGMRLGFISRLLHRKIVAPPVPTEACATDWVAGASMMIRREVFKKIGMMDEDYFMYFEEVDFCLRANRAGWACWYVPASRVVHLVGQSSGVTDVKQARKRRPAYWFASRKHFFKKNFGLFRMFLANVAWASAYMTYGLRRLIQRKPNTDPQWLLWDFIKFNFMLGAFNEPPNTDPAYPTVEGPTEPASPAGPRMVNRGDRNMNPPRVGLMALLLEDRKTHGSIWEQGFWAVAVHRFGNWRMDLPSGIRPPFTLLYRFLFKWVEWTCGITLPYTVILGRRVRIWHHGGMILHAARIGNDVHIRQNTTFGIARKDRLHELPTIGDRADLGCGVAILGDVYIGHDSVIGANAVVLKDVPPRSVAVGVPAKVVKTLPGVTETKTWDLIPTLVSHIPNKPGSIKGNVE